MQLMTDGRRDVAGVFIGLHLVVGYGSSWEAGREDGASERG